MLAIFLDVQNEILDISREFGVMQRKVRRFELAEDLEDKDSHTRAIAGCIHGIYSGMDNLTPVKDFDGITGKMTFTPGGNPAKYVVIVKISDKGDFEFYKSVCP